MDSNVAFRTAVVVAALAAGACSGAEIFPAPGEARHALVSSAPQAVLSASDSSDENWFGIRVAIDGDTAAVVGRSRDADSALTLYVFTRSADGWVEQQRFFPSDPQAYAGMPIALRGDTLAMASPGGIYIFSRVGGRWRQTQKLELPAPSLTLPYDPAIAMAGDDIVMGWPSDTAQGSNAGAAFVYRRSGSVWTLSQKIVATDGAPDDLFGTAVAVEADRLVIGAPGDDDAAEESGSAYVYVRSMGGWVPQKKLLPSGDSQYANFGYAVALGRGTLVVGAPGDPTLAESAGAAYAFIESRAGWVKQAKLFPSEGKEHLLFGGSVAADGATLVVGSQHSAWLWHEELGAAYVFGRSSDGSWAQRGKLTSGAPEGLHTFGFSVGIHGNACLVGSPQAGVSGPGGVYAFDLE